MPVGAGTLGKRQPVLGLDKRVRPCYNKEQMLRYNCFFIFAAGAFSPKVLRVNAVKTKTKQLKTAASPEQEPLGAKKLGAAKKLPVLGR